MELLALIVGIIGNASSCVVFAAPLVTFWRIIRKRDTESFSPVPYVMCLMSQILWVYYGALDPNGLLIVTISAVGVVFELIYLTIFVVLASTPHRLAAIKLVTLSMMAFVALFLGTFLGSRGNKRLNIVGFLCAINSICMYAAPLSIMKKVITTKSVEYMPFFVTLSLFINGGTWTTYAIVVRDLFIAVPNGIGFLFGIAQLLLYFIHYKRKPNQFQDTDKPLNNVKPIADDQKALRLKGEEHHKYLQEQLV